MTEPVPTSAHTGFDVLKMAERLNWLMEVDTYDHANPVFTRAEDAWELVSDISDVFVYFADANGNSEGWVRIIIGNGPVEALSDYSTSLDEVGIDTLFKNAERAHPELG